MAIALPERTASAVGSLTPRQIVAELDKFVVGQAKAKRAVAIALRNRFRRQQLSAEMAEEVTPKNILMIGPTGVGKTEIARRLAKLAQSPFIKVEASKFTEVGYVGRDVESMVRDLVELAVEMVRGERADEVGDKARVAAEERLLDLLLPPTRGFAPAEPRNRTASRTRERMRERTARRPPGRTDRRTGHRDAPMPSFEVIAGSSAEEISSNLKDMMGQFFQNGPRTRKLQVPEALTQLAAEEQAKLVDMESVGQHGRAPGRAERHHLHRRDRQDRQPRRRRGGHGPDVSREGVQRDILPIVEGTTVNTKHGFVRTDHILFIAAGRVPRVEAVGSDPRAAGPVPDSCRAGGADARRLRPHPHRAARLAGEAVHGAARAPRT